MAQKASGKPLVGGLVMLRHDLITGEYGIHFDISEGELATIGYAVIQWAYLEHALHYRTFTMAKRNRIALPEDANNFSFSKRLRAFRQLVEQVIKRPKYKKELLELIDQIGSAEGNRHRIVHDAWFFNPRKANQLWSLNLRKKGARLEPFDEKKIWKFAEHVGTLSFRLEHPRGERDVRLPYAWMSRSFLQAIQETSQQSQGPPSK